jgi:hypothetical protein
MATIDNSSKHQFRLLSEFFALTAEQTFQATIATINAPYTVMGCTVIPAAQSATVNSAILAAYAARDATRATAVTMAGRAIGHDRA